MASANPPVLPVEVEGPPPRKVAWLHPTQLLRTAYHVWLSSTATEYIDRRETLAALDNARASVAMPDHAPLRGGKLVDAVLQKNRGSVTIDYIADIGDSWEATYAVVRLAVTEKLRLRGHVHELDPADILVLGGDLVYPTPTREGYRRKTRSPLVAARPALNGRAPCLLAIPGNHDWYDGLTNFVREFCQGQRLGGWSMIQRRSYFAVKLTPGWWLWGIDIALDTRIDSAQQAYFLNLLKKPDDHSPPNEDEQSERIQEHDNIILCTAKPAWIDERTSDAYRNLSYFVQEIIENHGGRVRVILAGDTHHYSRYENRRGDHLITAGGGGAYLSATHRLPLQVSALCSPPQESGLAGVAPGTEPRPEDAFHASEFPYPNRRDSQRMALGALMLAFRPANWPFVLFLGLFYWFFIWTLMVAQRTVVAETAGTVAPSVADSQVQVLNRSIAQLAMLPFDIALTPSATVVFFIVLFALAVCATIPAVSRPTSSRWVTIPWGLTHAVLHMTLALVVARQIHQYTGDLIVEDMRPLAMSGVALRFSLGLIVLGGVAGATLVGAYFVVSDCLLRLHTNEVFAAQSIVHYRNFLRMRLGSDGTLTILPVGLRKVPRKWRLRLYREDDEPLYEPADRVLDPHLIEGPLVIRPRR